MPFPTTSQLATPLGDLLPMRLSWMFVGYSAPYQIFAGVTELLTGLLLLFRRTATLGALVATGVFLHVLALNLCYDIPVKIYSMLLSLLCFFLLAQEYKRLAAFFLQHKAVAAGNIYQVTYREKWLRYTRVILKILFIAVYAGWMFYDTMNRYREEHKINKTTAGFAGIYDVERFALNGDTLPPFTSDTLRWQEVILEPSGRGSMKNSDSLLRRVYNRTYFNFYPDTTAHLFGFKKRGTDAGFAFQLHYEIPDNQTIILLGKRAGDSLYVLLKRSNRHFQLTEKQFHWLSEANR